jgi:chaperone protein DnaJ
MSHVFISYSRDDSEYAHRLVDALEQNGFTAWIDERIDYGTQWPRVIQKHVDECSAFIVIMTSQSDQSDWVHNELGRAKRKGKHVFPLLLEGEQWLSVETIQYLDVRDGRLPPPDFFERLSQVAPRYTRHTKQDREQSSSESPSFGSVSDIFEEFFGGSGGSRRATGPRRGKDLRQDLTITFEEAVLGVEKELRVGRSDICPRCIGSGAEPGTSPVRCASCQGSGEVRRRKQSELGSFVHVTTCPVCDGTGENIPNPCTNCNGTKQVRQSRTLKVKIPPGVDSGTQIRLSGEGEPGANGGPYGNLYVVLTVKEHVLFRRQDDDILLDLNISVAQATRGDNVTVPTIDSEEILEIPAGTQPGTVFKLKGRGVPHLRRSGRGDQQIIVHVASS